MDLALCTKRPKKSLPQSFKAKLEEQDSAAGSGEKSVYRVRDTLQKTVALLKPMKRAHKHEHFLREALFYLHYSTKYYPLMIKLTAEKPYFTMELVKGDTLEDLIGKQSLKIYWRYFTDL